MTTLALADGGTAAFDDALTLMAALTPRLTSEFPIRRLLEADLGRALPLVLTWIGHPDEHVHRLASEGTRAYLPWAVRVRASLVKPSATCGASANVTLLEVSSAKLASPCLWSTHLEAS